MRAWIALGVGLLAVAVPVSGAQTSSDRARARAYDTQGWDYMKSEAWPEAAKAFQQAIDIDPQFELAYWGLGRADMAMKRYVEAATAYIKCRDLYRARVGRRFSNAQEAQRYRNDQITRIDEMIRQVNAQPQTMQTTDMMRQLQNQRRDYQEAIQRGNDLTIGVTVPAWLSLALGSAYFRAEKLADAEREYKAAIDADSKTGEAHNNLAVVYLQTGRIEQAEKSVKAAEKAGYKVNPMLKDEIAVRKKGGSN
jgi:tetratricopeptide (TPR) repeat protein